MSEHKQHTASGHINTRMAWRPILRPIATLLIAAQLALMLQPLSASAQSTPSWIAGIGSGVAAPIPSPLQGRRVNSSRTADASDALARAQELVAQIKSNRSSSAAPRQQELRALVATIRAAGPDVRTEFSAVREELVSGNLSGQILKRHDDAVAQFEQRLAEFDRATLNTDDGQLVSDLGTFFSKYPAKKHHRRLDPSKLPWSAPKAVQRMPAETAAAWYQRVTGDEAIQLAQAGPLTTLGGVQFTQLPQPGQTPQDADLAESAEVRLTPALRNKALELNGNPVAIINWVRNTVQWVPTWGSVQDAEGTLKALKGNSFDIASLTIALLRASGIPARYQFGTIDLPAAQVMNWVGNARTPEIALNLLSQGGVAARGIAAGGRIATIRMEHVWVNALVNWTPSRGARQGGNAITPPVLRENGQPQHPNPNGLLNLWVPIDGSYKQYVYSSGTDVRTAVPIDPSTLVNAAQQGATVTPDYVQNLNQAGLLAQLNNYQDRFQSYLKGQNPNATIDDILGARLIKSTAPGMLAGVLPYPVIKAGIDSAEVPDALRWKVSFHGYALDGGGGQGPTLIERAFNLSELLQHRVGITYVGATPADQEAIDSYRSSGATSFPAYALNVKPLFQIDGNTMAAGSAVGMARDVEWNVNIIPAGQTPVTGNQQIYAASAGDEMVWAIVGDAMSASQVQSMSFPATAAGNLHAVGVSFWHQVDGYAQLIARREHAVVQRMPSLGVVSSALTVQFIWGIPRSAFYKGRTIDIGHSTIGAQGMDSAMFQREWGIRTSYLEGNIFDQVFNREMGSGLSAIRLIETAIQSGQRVYKLNSGNADQYLGLIEMSLDVRDDIMNALLMGLEITIPEASQYVNGWQGTAYVVIRPETGAGSYNISGGLRGGDEGSDCKLQPSTSPAAEAVSPVVLFAAAIIAAMLVAALLPEILPGLAAGVVLGAISQTAAAAPLPQLPSPLDGIWNRVGGGRPWPSQFNWPPAGSYLGSGLCSSEQHAALQLAVKAACDRPHSCAGEKGQTASCEQIDANMQIASECIAARVAIMDTCYQSGDAEHWGEIEKELKAIFTCTRCRALKTAQQCGAAQ